MVPSKGSNENPGDDVRAVTRSQLSLLSTALVITALDQVVKRVVVNTMELGQSIDVVGSVVRLTRTSNTGGAFGLLRGQGSWFVVVSAVAALAIAVMSRQIARGRRIERIAFGLILGGAVGNLIDRIRLGSVIDFIDVGGSAYRWPAFNVADSGITIGVTLLAITLIFLSGTQNGREPAANHHNDDEPRTDAGEGR
jgi:signal peptidase II